MDEASSETTPDRHVVVESRRSQGWERLADLARTPKCTGTLARFHE
jgi:hypothetical protein